MVSWTRTFHLFLVQLDNITSLSSCYLTIGFLHSLSTFTDQSSFFSHSRLDLWATTVIRSAIFFIHTVKKSFRTGFHDNPSSQDLAALQSEAIAMLFKLEDMLPSLRVCVTSKFQIEMCQTMSHTVVNFKLTTILMKLFNQPT